MKDNIKLKKTSLELRELQLKCLEILKVVDDICRKNKIEYSLCGGSVVGAHLYGGFIPWDDDIDLMMTRVNYEKFIKVCENFLPSRYELQNYKTSSSYKTLFSKVVDRNTTLVQYDNKGNAVVNGVFLDITVYDKVPNSILKKIDFAVSNFAQKLIYFDTTDKTTIKKRMLSLIGNNCSPIYIIIENIFNLFSNSRDYSYCELFGAFCTNKLYKKEIFESYVEIQFEGNNYMIVRDYMEYLIHRYERTDFYEPEEKQISPHYSYVNLKLPYLKYIDGVK